MTAPTLTIWLYDAPMGAAAGEVRLKDLQERGAVRVHDAVTVTWVRGAHEPRIGHLRHRTTRSAVTGSVLGALVGTLLLAPVVGAAAGAGLAAWTQHLRDAGIDDDTLEAVRRRLQPGTSALLVLSSDANLDVVRPFVERGLARGDVTLVHAQLAEGAPEQLRRALQELSSADWGRWPDPGEAGPRVPS